MPSVYIRTFGCQMNVRDSEVIAGLLTNQGLRLTEDEALADILIYNTCSVRKHAEDKVWSELGRHKKKDSRRRVIGVAGCMAQCYKDEIFQRAPCVDFVVGPSDIHKIPEIIEKLSACQPPAAAEGLFERKIWQTNGGIRPEEIYHTGFYEDKNHAYMVVSEGCSNYCSYCVVPYVRGGLKNRKCADIISEIKAALNKGITNVTLLGQNVNAYQNKDTDFIKLLSLVNKIEGLKQFSFITSHPKDTGVDLFQAMAGLEKLKKYLHLPVQSGSDRILELMNRGYTRADYQGLIRAYRNIVSKGVLTTDVIVGFPGETEKDFRQSYDLIKEAQFDSAYIFKYSPRPHTRAEALADDVPTQEKQRRHCLILGLQKEISKKCKNPR